MARSVTVRLPNGSSHVYEDVPEDVTDADVQARAIQDFPDKMATAEGQAPEAAQVNIAPPAPDQNVPTFAQYSTLPQSATQLGGAAMVPFQMAAEHPTEAAGLVGLYKFGQGVNAYTNRANAEANAANARTAQMAKTEARIAGGGAYGRGIPPVAGPVAPPNPAAGLYAGQGANIPGAPTAAPVQTAQAAEESLAQRVRNAAASKISGLAEASPMLAKAGKFAGRVLPGAGAALGGLEAYNRAQQGDYLGAGLAGIGGAASFVPVVGTAVNLGTTAINAGRDYSKYLEAKRKYEEQQKAMGR